MSKHKKTLSRACPDCRSSKLQLRTFKEKGMQDGVELTFDNDYVVCPKCGYEEVKESKKKWRVEIPL